MQHPQPPLQLSNYTFFFIFIFMLLLLLLLPDPTHQTPTLISPVSKDESTNLFTLSVYLKTPLQPTKLYLDLSFLFPWTLCNSTTYNSSSYRFVDCDTKTFCESLGFGALICNNCALDNQLPDPNCLPGNMVCGSFPENPITKAVNSDAALIDTLALPNSDESTQPQLVTLPNFTFSCARSNLLKGLPKTVTGSASLGRSNLSIQAQIGSAFNTPNIVTVCFPGSYKSTGVAFFGSTGPYNVLFSNSSKINLSKSLIYTPLITNPVGVGDTVINYRGTPPSNEYFIGLKSIKVNGQRIPINASLLTIDNENGFGGTKISTATPYTLLESSVYKVFVEMFVKEASSSDFNLTVVRDPVKPFSVCYDAGGVKGSDVGPVVPTIDLVMHRDDVVWRILGVNSMVKVKEKKKKKVGFWCLGFMDGGVNKKTPIVIGGKQLEENLVQFDLVSDRLGFISLPALQSLSCADFNVTDFAAKKN